MSQLEASSDEETGGDNDDDSQCPDVSADVGDALQLSTIGGIEGGNEVANPASSTVVEGNKLENSTVNVNNAPVTNIVNNFQQVQNPPVADQHIHEPLQSSQSSQSGLLEGGVDIQCRWFTLKLHGRPATVLVAGTVCAGFGLGVYTLSTVAQIVEVVAPLATQVILKVVSGSLFIHVLTQGNEAKQVLLHDLSSNRLLRVVQEIAEQENLKVEAINLVGVAAVVITQQEFKKLKKTSKKKLKGLRHLNNNSLQTITSHHSILQNQARTLFVEIPPKEEKEYIDCLKRNEEFWKGAKNKNLNRSHSCTEFKVAEKVRKTDVSSKFVRRNSIHSLPVLQRDTTTHFSQSIQNVEENKTFSKRGFLKSHPRFSEFEKVSSYHPELQTEISTRLKALKNAMWIESTQSIIDQVEELTRLPSQLFTGECIAFVRDVIRISRVLYVRFDLDFIFHFRLYYFALDLFKNISDVSMKRKFLISCCCGLGKFLNFAFLSPYGLLCKEHLSEILRRVLTMVWDYHQEHHSPSIVLQAHFRYFWKIVYDEYTFLPDPQENLDLTLTVASSLNKKLTKGFAYECRQLIKLPAVTLDLKSVDKALELVKILKEKSKFCLCLQMARWCESLIADFVEESPGQTECSSYASFFSIYKLRVTDKPRESLSMKAYEKIMSEIYSLLCWCQYMLHVQTRTVISWHKNHAINCKQFLRICRKMFLYFYECKCDILFDPLVDVHYFEHTLFKMENRVIKLKQLCLKFISTLNDLISQLQHEYIAHESLMGDVLRLRLAMRRILVLSYKVASLLDAVSKHNLAYHSVSSCTISSISNLAHMKSTETDFESEAKRTPSAVFSERKDKLQEEVVRSIVEDIHQSSAEEICRPFIALDWPEGMFKATACEYLLKKVERLSDLICDTTKEWLCREYGLQEIIAVSVIPLLQNMHLTIQNLHGTQPSELQLQMKISFSIVINIADFFYYSRQYEEVSETLDFLLSMIRDSEDCFDDYDVGCCLHLRAIAKQSLGLNEQALADCAEAIMCFAEAEESDDDEQLKQLNSIKKFKVELQIAI